MNIDRGSDRTVPVTVWEHPEMRAALGRRDLATVYRRLGARGISQRRIAALTDQGQSEVHEIISGRQVLSYDVLARIADGLGIPRGYMGLAYDESTERALDVAAAACSTEPDEREQTRRLLSHAANVLMDAATPAVQTWWQPVEVGRTPHPAYVGMSDMFHLENITAVLRALDYQYGGGACRDAVVAQTRWAQQLLTADYTPQVGQRLILALADLHNLAGWTSFDSGMYSAARLHFARALEQAKHVGDSSLVANVLYRMGKLHLYRGLYREALKCFQLGQIAAQDSGCKLTVAMLCANQAWSYALLGDVVPALNSISQAKDEFAHADRDTAPAWVHFFGQADLHASEGMVYASMPETTEAQLTSAVDSLRLSFGIRDDAMARSRTLELITLATSLLKLNSLDEGVALGHEAVDITTRLRSVRTAERLELLQVEAASHRTDDATRDLGERIATLRPV